MERELRPPFPSWGDKISTLITRSGLFGHDKTVITFDGQTILIKRGTLGRDESKIPVSKVTMVHYKKPFIGGGHIQFVASGVDGEIKFASYRAKEFEALRDAVDAAVAA